MDDVVKCLATDIPWRQIRGTRSRVLHSYRQIEFDIVSNIGESHLEPLNAEIDRLIARLQAGRS